MTTRTAADREDLYRTICERHRAREEAERLEETAVTLAQEPRARASRFRVEGGLK